MKNITDWKKHGYSYGLSEIEPMAAMKLFCKRRSGDVVKAAGDTLPHNDLLARIYYQGLMDGADIFTKNKSTATIGAA